MIGKDEESKWLIVKDKIVQLNLHSAATYEAASNQSPKIILEKNGKWKLY